MWVLKGFKVRPERQSTDFKSDTLNYSTKQLLCKYLPCFFMFCSCASCFSYVLFMAMNRFVYAK